MHCQANVSAFTLAFFKCLLISVRIPVSHYQRPTSLYLYLLFDVMQSNHDSVRLSARIHMPVYFYYTTALSIYLYTEINLYKANKPNCLHNQFK